MIKAIIFDMDGVLIDSEPHELKKHKDYLISKGIYLTQEKLNLTVGAGSKLRWECFKDILHWNMTREEYDSQVMEFYKDTIINYQDILNSGALDLLHWLNNEPYKIALASSATMKKIEMVLDQCGIRNYFDVILSGEMFNNSKPNPDIYLTTAKKLGFNPEECLVVEDSIYGITAAKTAGMYTVALEENRFGFDQSNADIKVSNLLDLKEILKIKG